MKIKYYLYTLIIVLLEIKIKYYLYALIIVLLEIVFLKEYNIFYK